MLKSFSRFDLCCPICGAQAQEVIRLNFSQRHHLPAEIVLALCEACDFAFTSPADAEKYANYYAETKNDRLLPDSVSEKERYSTQAGFLAPLLSGQSSKRVVDIGCGNGGLLRKLKANYPQHHYHGIDPNQDGFTTSEGISFSQSREGLERQYDLIIMSHILEHVVDLKELSSICQLLAPNGALYLEVPNAARYADFLRREYLYYIDRLHINHFTLKSLRRAVEVFAGGLSISWFGFYEFQYKDDKPYPACCVLVSHVASTPKPVESLADSLSICMQRYLQAESDRARLWGQHLGNDAEILVYGFGDNFMRAMRNNGPLFKCKIKAVIDKRWKELREYQNTNSFHFVEVGYALEHYKSLPVVVTVSWQGERIVQELKGAGFEQVYIL